MQPQSYSVFKESELCFTSDECDIYFNSELQAIEYEWKGVFFQGKPLEMVYNKIIEFIELKKTNAIIVDARNMRIVTVEDQSWIVENWYPRAFKSGLNKQVFIVERYSFGETSLKKIVNILPADKIVTDYVHVYKNAVDWILNNVPAINTKSWTLF